jgi:hypothetical protein
MFSLREILIAPSPISSTHIQQHAKSTIRSQRINGNQQKAGPEFRMRAKHVQIPVPNRNIPATESIRCTDMQPLEESVEMLTVPNANQNKPAPCSKKDMNDIYPKCWS